MKKRWKILPILYEGIIYDNPEIIEHKLVVEGIQVREKGNQRNQNRQENSIVFRQGRRFFQTMYLRFMPLDAPCHIPVSAVPWLHGYRFELLKGWRDQEALVQTANRHHGPIDGSQSCAERYGEKY